MPRGQISNDLLVRDGFFDHFWVRDGFFRPRGYSFDILFVPGAKLLQKSVPGAQVFFQNRCFSLKKLMFLKKLENFSFSENYWNIFKIFPVVHMKIPGWCCPLGVDGEEHGDTAGTGFKKRMGWAGPDEAQTFPNVSKTFQNVSERFRIVISL